LVQGRVPSLRYTIVNQRARSFNPVLEAMAQGTPVVTSRGTATEETAGGMAVLVDPFDVDDIARGIAEALSRRDELGAGGAAHARRHTWSDTAALTLSAYREVAR
jgi:glycosyltransferase involved in cell wall biosynthesis